VAADWSAMEPALEAAGPTNKLTLTYDQRLHQKVVDVLLKLSVGVGDVENLASGKYRGHWFVDAKQLAAVSSQLRSSGTAEEPLKSSDTSGMLMEVTQVLPIPNRRKGQGRVVRLKNPLTMGEVVQMTKKHLDVQRLRMALAEKHLDTKWQDAAVQTIGVCAGSGGSVLSSYQGGRGLDVFVTGEMLHHDILAAAANGTTILLSDHTRSERGFLASFSRQLLKGFTRLLPADVAQPQVIVSTTDSDPLEGV